MELDDTDREILRILQQDARTPFSEIARQIDMSSATVHDRVGRLVEEGVIEGYHARINPEAVGLEAQALVGLRFEQGKAAEARQRLRELEEVQSVRLLAGRWDLVARVYAEDVGALRDLMFDEIAEMEGFSRSEMEVILGTDYSEPGPPF